MSPLLIFEDPQVYSMECLLVDDCSVPVFNSSEVEVLLPASEEIGFLEPSDQNINKSRLTEINLSELRFALQHNCIDLDEVPGVPISCNVVQEDTRPKMHH